MIDVAEVLIDTIRVCGLDRQVALSKPLVWRQGERFSQSTNPYTRRLGYILMLTAIVETPEAASTLFASVRDLLQDEQEGAA